MITLQQYARVIQNQLNESNHTKAFKFTFKVFADIGDYQEAFKSEIDTKKINCLIRETAGDYTPIKTAKTKFTNLVFEVAVNQQDVDEMKIILNEWSTNQLGVIYQVDDCTYIVTPSAIQTGTAVNTCELGSTLPLTMAIELQETEVGLISNEMVWTLATGDINATEVEVLRGQILSQRTQQSENYMNEDEIVSTNQASTLSIQMTIPVAKNNICKEIYNAIIKNRKDETYTIKMEDGWSDGIDDDFILSSGELVFEATKVVAMTCTFLKEDKRLA